MSDNVPFQSGTLATPAPGVIAESVDQGGGVQRQVVKIGVPGTGAETNVASSATVVTVLAANAARMGAAITNDSSAILYLKLGAGASSTSYTVQMAANSYYEVPFGYTGIITGIWASATGNARVTELT